MYRKRRKKMCLFIAGVVALLSTCTTECDTLTRVWEHQFEEPGGAHPFFALEDGRIYVQHDTNRLYCLSTKKGDILWEISTEESIYSPPVASSGRVYFTTKTGKTSTLFCIDGETGTPQWKRELHTLQWHFTVSDSSLYIYDKGLCCYHAVTGDLVWNNQDIPLTWGPVATEGEHIAVGSLTSSPDEEQQFTIFYVDAKKGSIIWTRGHSATPGKLLMGNGKSYNMNVYGVQCIALSQPEMLWEADLGNVTSAVLSEGRIYGVTWGSTVWCLDSETGTEVWTYTIVGKEVPVTHPIDWVAVSVSPQIVENKVYTGSQIQNPYIYCFDAETGDVLWRYDKGECWYSAPFVENGNLYYGVYCEYSGIMCYRVCSTDNNEQSAVIITV
ncbi:MAG: PQQ-binding-like beta-propeller repeat protein [Theionarchaea archaeon]|nr:PQQ-binding-like beta-propeller repeat protein [Theionarchaea archaeon]